MDRKPLIQRKTAISYKTEEKTVLRGYDVSELAEAVAAQCAAPFAEQYAATLLPAVSSAPRESCLGQSSNSWSIRCSPTSKRGSFLCFVLFRVSCSGHSTLLVTTGMRAKHFGVGLADSLNQLAQFLMSP